MEHAEIAPLDTRETGASDSHGLIIRPLDAVVGPSSCTGSGLFTRKQTQALSGLGSDGKLKSLMVWIKL